MGDWGREMIADISWFDTGFPSAANGVYPVVAEPVLCSG